MNKLEQLKKYTVVVADSGDIDTIARFRPQDCTTNPSLILQASKNPTYEYLLKEGAVWAKENAHVYKGVEVVSLAAEKVATNFVAELIKLVPGLVSIEVDATLAFDTQQTIRAGHRLVEILGGMGISKDRLLIKIPTTWEGIKACEQLEKEGIHCNMTLLFSKVQAIMAADVGAFLISPFVGRILDWYKSKGLFDEKDGVDPGVQSVIDIFNYYKNFSYKTIVMGASFRNLEEIEALCGLDRLTIAPAFLDALQQDDGSLEPKISIEKARKMSLGKVSFDEVSFRWAQNQDAMAVEKLGEGIRNFAKDLETLKKQMTAYL